ncbi:hypothetical protein ES705_22649 [subsurface metagenome]
MDNPDKLPAALSGLTATKLRLMLRFTEFLIKERAKKNVVSSLIKGRDQTLLKQP